MLNRMQHPYMGDVILPSSPLRLFEYETSPLQFFPEVGADSRAVLAELAGISESELDELSADGVI
jgi:crotonobetainyl-CoA:carnitine CoA-transferase CaiB-like acyl-CoA transferase